MKQPILDLKTAPQPKRPFWGMPECPADLMGWNVDWLTSKGPVPPKPGRVVHCRPGESKPDLPDDFDKAIRFLFDPSAILALMGFESPPGLDADPE